LLCQLRNSESTVLLRATAGKRSKARHEEVKTREGNHVDSELAKISIELSREAQASGDTRHGGRDKMVEISVGRGGELEGTEADVVESLVVNAVGLVGVLNELVDGKCSVVGFDDGVGHLRGGDNRKSGHDTVGVFLADLGDQKGAHT